MPERLLCDWPLLGSWKGTLGRTLTSMDRTVSPAILYYHHRHTEVRRPRKRCSKTALKGLTLARSSCDSAAVPRPTAACIVQDGSLTPLHSRGVSRQLIVTPQCHRRQVEVGGPSRACYKGRYGRSSQTLSARLLHETTSWHCTGRRIRRSTKS